MVGRSTTSPSEAWPGPQARRMVEQVWTTSSHQRAAGTWKRTTYGSDGSAAGSASRASGRPQPAQVVATSTCWSSAAMIPKESQAHPPHHFCSAEATTKCIGRAENGWAMRIATRSASRTSTCSSCRRPQPASTSSTPIWRRRAASAAVGGRPSSTNSR
jgi:hypothetical protein